LTAVTHAIIDAASIDDVMRLAVERAVEILPATKACLLIKDGDGLLRIRAAAGVDADALKACGAPPDERLFVSWAAAALSISAEQPLIAVPMVLRGEVAGVLVAARSCAAQATEEDEWLLSALADQTAVALDNARLGNEAHRREKELQVLAKAKSARDRALAMVVHDVRSPLSAISLFVQVMESGNPGPLTESQRSILNRIRSTCRHISEVVSNMLDMAVLESAAVQIRPALVPVQPIMHEAAVVSGADANQKQLTIRIEQSDLVVYADANRVRQVLVNLISNAVKHTPHGGSVEIRAAAELRNGRRWGVISVKDSGPGIASEEHEAIFEPYYRVGRPPSVSDGGVGLGLAISRELARRMEGDVGIRSVPGHGATFEVCLPLDPRPHR
jgi:signal transduction histidine kinase